LCWRVEKGERPARTRSGEIRIRGDGPLKGSSFVTLPEERKGKSAFRKSRFLWSCYREKKNGRQ